MSDVWLDETHRRIGAICNWSTKLEYQLESAYMELTGSVDMTETQGEWHSANIRRLRRALAQRTDLEAETIASLRAMLVRASAAMKLRDQVVHVSWIRKNTTPPGHVTGVRWFRNREDTRDWSMTQLDQIVLDLKSSIDELASAFWNATRPRGQQI